MKTLVFAGSTRTDSFHRKLAREAARQLPDATYVELADYPMPLYDGDTEAASGIPANALAFKQLVRDHNAIFIASPEYNGSFPALVKNVIDWITRPVPGEPYSSVFKDKIVGLLATSPGPGGGVRGLRHLRELFEMVGARVLPEQVIVPKAFHAFDPDGVLTRPEDRAALDALVRANVESSAAHHA